MNQPKRNPGGRRFAELRGGFSALILALLAASASAQDDELSFTATTGLATRYVRRGVERSTLAAQGALDGSVGGLRGRVWFNRPLDTSEPGELQTSLGYLWTVTKTLNLEASGTHFWYIDTPVRGDAAHSFEAALNMNWNPVGMLRFGLGTSYDIRRRSVGGETWAAYDVALKSWGTFLEGRVYAGHLAGKDVLPNTTGPTVRDSYSYWGADLRLPYRISFHTTIAAEVHVVETRGRILRGRLFVKDQVLAPGLHWRRLTVFERRLRISPVLVPHASPTRG